MNGIPEDKYSVCPDTGLNVCELFDGVWVREDGMIKRTPHPRNTKTNPDWHAGNLSVYGKNKTKRYKSKIGTATYYVHRLICMAFKSNYSKDLVVDHINGDGTNNHVSNLRCVTNRENGLNQVIHRNGKLPGCSFHKETGKYSSQCKHNKIKYHIGLFPTEQEAHEAYVKFKQERNLS